MDDPHWLGKELAGAAAWKAIEILVFAGAAGVALAWKKRRRIEVEALQPLTLHANMPSVEAKAIWNTEARNRLTDWTLEAASWVIPDLVRHALR